MLHLRKFGSNVSTHDDHCPSENIRTWPRLQMQILSVVLEVWNRLIYTEALKRLKYAHHMVGYKSPLTYSLVLIQVSRTLEYWLSPSSDMLKHQKGSELRVVERSCRPTYKV